MRRFARLPSRLLAVAGAALIGGFGAVAFAAPASATFTTLKAEVACPDANGNAVVTWSLKNIWKYEATVSKLSRKLDGTLADDAKFTMSTISGTETVDFSKVKESKLSLHIKFSNGHQQDVKGIAKLPKEGCESEHENKPTVTYTDNCDGTVSVQVVQTDGKFQYAVNGKGDFVKRSQTIDGKGVFDVTVPAANAEKIVVKQKAADADDKKFEKISDHQFKGAEKCEVTATAVSSCDLVITVENPNKDSVRVAVSAPGFETKEVDVAGGETHDFTLGKPLKKGLVATVKIGDKTQTFTWDDTKCAPEGGLAQTGANTPLMAGGAAALVAAGAGLFFVARRRRIRFAA